MHFYVCMLTSESRSSNYPFQRQTSDAGRKSDAERSSISYLVSLLLDLSEKPLGGQTMLWVRHRDVVFRCNTVVNVRLILVACLRTYGQ